METTSATQPPSETQTSPAPAASPAATDYPVTLTAKAVEMVKTTRAQDGIEDSYGLRIAVRGGGCSGFEYALDFEDEQRDTDMVYDQGGMRIIVDPVSARYLTGTEIDYVFGMQGAGFKFHNPNAMGTCGCGSSFSV